MTVRVGRGRWFGVVGAVLVMGCSLEGEGLGVANELIDGGDDAMTVADTSVVAEDSGAPEGEDTSTEAPDTFVIDTGADMEPPDTLPPDTGPLDTGPLDTGPLDTGPLDTGPLDTGPLDTGPPDTGATGSVTVSVTTLPATAVTFNLTTEGTRDWAHWGHTASDSFNRKFGRTAIDKGTRTGANTFESIVYHFTWTDGSVAPTAVTATPRGLTTNAPGENVTFDVQGDPLTELTLSVWVSGTSNGAVTGTLTGTTVPTVSANLAAGVYIVRFKFRTATAAGKLRVATTKGAAAGSFNHFAAALQ